MSQSYFLLSAFLHQLDQRIFAVVLRVDLTVQRGHALRCGDNRVLVDGHIRVLQAAGLSSCNLGFHLVEDGLEALGVAVRLQLVADDNGFPVVDELLQAHLLIIGEIPVLSLFQQVGDLPVHAVEAVNVGLDLVGHAGVPGFLRRCLQCLKLGAGVFREGLPGI